MGSESEGVNIAQSSNVQFFVRTQAEFLSCPHKSCTNSMSVFEMLLSVPGNAIAQGVKDYGR